MASFFECIGQIAMFPYWLSRTNGMAPAENNVAFGRKSAAPMQIPQAGKTRPSVHPAEARDERTEADGAGCEPAVRTGNCDGGLRAAKRNSPCRRTARQSMA